tara:strand:- start:113846 stop:114871 length:1026 start_codon:yes stop_codon:yes gene_type:complete
MDNRIENVNCRCKLAKWGGKGIGGLVLRIAVIVAITVIVLIVLFLIAKPIAMKVITTRLAKIVWDQCKESVIEYRHPVYFPTDQDDPKFELKLAHTLWDIGGAASDAHCRDNIPMPRPFTKSQPLYGKIVQDVETGEDTPLKAGYIYWNPTTNWAMIVFSGTHYKEQWKNNMRMSQTKLTFLDESLNDVKLSHRCKSNVKSSLIHSGFYDDYDAIRECIHKWLDGKGLHISNILVTGRSLGGAVSTLCAYDLSYVHRLSVVHYSFASPRVGNKDFADRFNSRVPYSIRVFNTSDQVCDLPLTVFGKDLYQHTGKPNTTFAFTINTGSLVNNHIEAYRDLEF